MVINNLKLSIDIDLEEHLRSEHPQLKDFRILKKSIDARKRHQLHCVYSVELFLEGDEITAPNFDLEKTDTFKGEKPIIVGSGPAGLFAALRFVERGIPCILLERGSECAKRMFAITKFWRYGELNEEDNVCFGEGGAGLYSDGKLITRIKSPFIPYVMNKLVQFGAPAEIEYLSNPHVGSDKIRRVIPIMRKYLIENGCEVHFNSLVTELMTEGDQTVGVKLKDGTEYKSDSVILATGHSNEKMFYHLDDIGVFLEPKSFAMGLRIEHPQSLINSIQYRDFADHPKLGSANYKVSHYQQDTGVGTYSFCMCPGGYVLSSGTEKNTIVCNGMSNYRRNSPYANAAIVVSIDQEKHFGGKLFGGLDMRRKLEQDTFTASKETATGRELPAQTLNDFFAGRFSDIKTKGSSPSGKTPGRLDEILPQFIKDPITEALEKFNKSMPGFINEDAVFYGVESRTSCPVRITRDKQTLESVSHKGLYPTGEGAGYAGGITSAACDGIKAAEAIINKLS